MRRQSRSFYSNIQAMDLRNAAMFRILQFGLCFLLVTAKVIPGTTAQTMSIDKQLLNAGGLNALDVFHVMDNGTVVVRQELDIMIPLVQFSEMMAAANSTRQKKNIMKDQNMRWPSHTIYYELTASVDNSYVDIEVALVEISKFSCLTFVKTEHLLPRIRYSGDNPGCSAYIGYQDSINDVNIARSCARRRTIQHETLHALGFFHEHSRPDRDKYLNIKPEVYNKEQYERFEDWFVETFGIEYDYRSVMHYMLKNYAKARDPSYQEKMGRYTSISFSDLKLLNVAYGCSDRYCLGPLYAQPCPFNGFRITRKLYGQSECQCWCHSGSSNNEDQFVLCSSLQKSMEPVYDLSLSSTLLDTEHEVCTDLLDNCTSLREKGFCFTELVKMKNLCTKTCKFCGKGQDLCMDHDESCVLMSDAGVCKDKGLETFMSNLCPKSCGQCTQHHSACDIQKAMEEPDTNIVNSAAINSQWITLLIVFYFLLG